MEPGAIVRALVTAGVPAVEAAIAAQTRPPAGVVAVPSVLAAAAGPAGAGAGAEWLWLLDGGAVPRPDALERLLAALDQAPAPPAPALLAAKVVDRDGRLVLEHAPWYRRGEPDLAMRAAVHRVAPVRAAGGACLLVRRDAAVAAGAPLAGLDGAGAALEWTARLLRERAGYLVPGAVAEVADATAAAGAAAAVHAGAAMLLSGAFRPKERLWLAPEVAGRARDARAREGCSRAALAGAAASGAFAAVRARVTERRGARP